MKIPACIFDGKGAMMWTEVELPLSLISRLRKTSAKQDATDWGLNNPSDGDRFGKLPLAQSQIDSVKRIHEPRLVVTMRGHRDIATGYDPVKKQFTAESRRFGVGEMFYIYGFGGHRPSGDQNSQTLVVSFANTGKWSGKDIKPIGVFK